MKYKSINELVKAADEIIGKNKKHLKDFEIFKDEVKKGLSLYAEEAQVKVIREIKYSLQKALALDRTLN